MFLNESTLRFAGNIGNISFTSSGCMKFGVCESTYKVVPGTDEKVNIENWMNVFLTKNQSERWKDKLHVGDEICVEGNCRTEKYESKNYTTLYVNRVHSHIPKLLRDVSKLLNKLEYSSAEQLVAALPLIAQQMQLKAKATPKPAPQATPTQAQPVNTTEISAESIALATLTLQQQQVAAEKEKERAADKNTVTPEALAAAMALIQGATTEQGKSLTTDQIVASASVDPIVEPAPGWVEKDITESLQVNASTFASGVLQDNSDNFFKVN
ncbi:single-stranded DNA-binding protein [Aliivibrio fischeri]|uniref:single-stranded DNA-binding protein n=1 Tax=Aliivibrio fischeri TaxID=668 RepID=UPI0012D867F5|nr:single-stranded DNA-binding protein [Aliivibrio fischeri]MUJ20322.1 single-stranded DNA-binding protein [Aliivibrio fischeri]